MTGNLRNRMAKLETSVCPPRVRTFCLPRAMTDAEADAWLKVEAPDMQTTDTAVMLSWFGDGERPAAEVGEIGRRLADKCTPNTETNQ